MAEVFAAPRSTFSRNAFVLDTFRQIDLTEEDLENIETMEPVKRGN